MNFDPKPVLEESAFFWFDEKKKEGIEFHGPDSFQYQQFELETGRAYAVARRNIADEKDEEVKGQITTMVLAQAWRKSLVKIFKSASKITLGDNPVTEENAADLFSAMSREQIIRIGNFVSKQESFLGKQ
ncbi:MAG: hypothetical protein ACPHUL_00805 [Marinomonas gallaica]